MCTACACVCIVCTCSRARVRVHPGEPCLTRRGWGSSDCEEAGATKGRGEVCPHLRPDGERWGDACEGQVPEGSPQTGMMFP